MTSMLSEEKCKQWRKGCYKVKQVPLCICSGTLYVVPTSTERSQESRILAIQIGQESVLRTRDDLITYIDDWFFFGPNIKEIQNVIKELEENGYDFTREDGD